MVGSIADGELIAAVRPARNVRFRVATPSDDAALRRLLRENPMPGAIRVSFEREPDYFRGAGVGGAQDRTIIASENDRLVCMGRCIRHHAWLNGAVRRVGYLGELRLDASARGRFDLLRGGYQFFRTLDEHDPADFHFTSIAADNLRARRFLERCVRRMPRYEFIGELTTLLIATSRQTPVTSYPLGNASHDELAAFFCHDAGRHNLSRVWRPETLQTLAPFGLTAEEFRVIRANGKILAAAALWDQRAFRQTVVRGYSRPLALLRPLLNSVGRICALPRLPARGSVLAHAFLFPPAVRPEHAHLLSELIASFRHLAGTRGIDYLTLALPSNDARLSEMRRHFRCRTYVTRLYRVRWPGDPAVALDSRPILPDIAFL